MAIFSVIDNSATGDTPYESFVKDAANWAIMETEILDGRSGYVSIDKRIEPIEAELTDARGAFAAVHDRLDADEVILADKAATTHTHGTGGTVLSLVADITALGTGASDGEMKICYDNGNRYTWESSVSKWRLMDGNKYTTGGLPSAASYLVATGTLVYDTTTNYWKVYNGASYVNAFLTWDGSATDIVAATARTSIGFNDGLKKCFLL